MTTRLRYTEDQCSGGNLQQVLIDAMQGVTSDKKWVRAGAQRKSGRENNRCTNGLLIRHWRAALGREEVSYHREVSTIYLHGGEFEQRTS